MTTLLSVRLQFRFLLELELDFFRLIHVNSGLN
jgi:hypothetical protein